MKKILFWLLRLISSLILFQTLYFKFTAHIESVYIFDTLGVEPWGRIASGIMELITGILLLIPRTVVFGAIAGVGLMAGAILSHIFFLGVEVREDGGLLFIYACIVFISCLILAFANHRKLQIAYTKIKSS